MKTKILDCTIRDGGYLNNWDFDLSMVKDLYRAVSKSGVDYIELGFRDSLVHSDQSNFPVWRLTPESAVESIVDGVTGATISLMIDYGKTDLKDIAPAAKSRVGLYRVAVHKDSVIKAISFCNKLSGLGYKVAIQLMGIVNYNDADFIKVIKPLKNSNLSFVYFADTYGSLLPADIKKYVRLLKKTDKLIGFHPHNNMQLAFANALEAIKLGVDIIDSTVFGMGRGAGNLPLETLISYCEKVVDKTKYNVLPILELINKYFLSLARDLQWGYNLPYMMSGIYEVHPNYATALTAGADYSIENIKSVLQLINKINPIGYDKNLIPQIIKTGYITNKTLDVERLESVPQRLRAVGRRFAPATYGNRHKGRDFLVLANGNSLIAYRQKINRFIKLYDPIIIGSNYLAGLFIPHYHSFNNKKRFEDFVSSVDKDSKLLLSNSFSEDYVCRHADRVYELIQHDESKESIFSIQEGIIYDSCRSIAVLSIAVAIVMGAKRIFVAGLDGYKDAETFITYSIKKEKVAPVKIGISVRYGKYKTQMEWDNSIARSLKQINEYLITNGLNDLIIMTPTTNKSYYKSIDSFLEKKL